MKIHESIQQILQAGDELGAMFYDRSLTQYPKLQQYYQDIDPKRQGALLVNALMIIERRAVHPTPATDLYLQHLGTKHHDRQVSRDVYDVWIMAMLEAIQEFHDQDWTPHLEEQWRQAFDRAVEIMFRGYDHRVTV